MLFPLERWDLMSKGSIDNDVVGLFDIANLTSEILTYQCQSGNIL
jgi:hypothetical protein